MPVLSGSQSGNLAKLLLNFTKAELRGVVLVSLNTRLDVIVNEDQELGGVALELANWANRRDRSTLVNLLQGLVTARPSDPEIWAFCDEVFPGEIQRLDKGELVDRVNRGIEALIALKELPIVQEVVGHFRADFVGASKQIQLLKKYKSLHEALHRLQFKMGTIEEVIESAQTNQRAARSLAMHGIELAPLSKKARQQAQGLPGAQNELAWIDLFDDCIATMNRASTQVLSFEDLHDLITGLDRLMGELPRINSLLANVAFTLPLDNLVQAMARIAKHLQERAGPRDAAPQQITGDLTSLGLLQPLLVDLVSQHFEWQWIDRELVAAAKLFRDEYGPKAKMPKKKWREFRTRFMQLCDQHPQDAWSKDLRDRLLLWEQSPLSLPPTKDETDASDSAFDEFHGACRSRFFEVDDELNALSGRLTELGTPLNSLLSVIGQ